jgi:3,4-dihydroxy-2-butanone 4-phosphate synthase
MIKDRINAVNTMFKSADGTVRLFVDDVKCRELVKDFKKVKWQQDSSGNTTGLLDKTDKNRTHISDAVGYAIEYLFSLRGKAGGRKGIVQ